MLRRGWKGSLLSSCLSSLAGSLAVALLDFHPGSSHTCSYLVTNLLKSLNNVDR